MKKILKLLLLLVLFSLVLTSCGDSDIPDGMPENCICVRFYCDEMAWLLPEKLNTTLTEKSSLGKAFARFTNKIKRSKKAENACACHGGELLCATGF